MLSLRRHGRRGGATVVLLASATLAAAPAGAWGKPAYTATPGPARAHASFAASYAGSGSYRTFYAAHPPNPGGPDDHNWASDTSRQRWGIRFAGRLDVPSCRPGYGAYDPCTAIGGLDGATGATEMTGRVRHKHIDGPYPVFDTTMRCTLRASTGRGDAAKASVAVRYLPDQRLIGLSASSPLSTITAIFPPQCPGQGDSLDRILDFYAMPGFSTAGGWGPDRWFASGEVAIPLRVLHRSKRIRIPLRLVPGNAPPADCAVLEPSYERCRTRGAWRGALTLRRRP